MSEINEITISLSQCKYEFLILLLSDKESLSDDNKGQILTELLRRNITEYEPH